MTTAPRATIRNVSSAILLPVVLMLAWQFGGATTLAMAGGAVLAAAAGVFILARPRTGVLFMVFYVYSGVGSVVPAAVGTTIMVAVLAARVLEMMRGSSVRLRDPVFWWSTGLFLAVCLQSMLIAHYIDLSFVRLSAYAKVLLLLFLIVEMVRDEEDLRRLGWTVFGGALATILFGVVGYQLGIHPQVNPIAGGGLVRFAGFHPDANDAAALMCSALPFGVFAARHCRRRALAVLVMAGLILLVVGVFFTMSRGAIVSLAFVALAVITREARRRRAWVPLLLLLASAVLLTPKYYWNRLNALGDLASALNDWSILMRVRALKAAWQLFTEHPFTGIGIGNFSERSDFLVWIRIAVHNSYMEVLVSTGIFGLAAFAAMLWSGLRFAIRGVSARFEGMPEWFPSLCYYATVSLVSMMISALFLSVTYRYALWIPVAAGLVIGNVLRRGPRARHTFPPSKSGELA